MVRQEKGDCLGTLSCETCGCCSIWKYVQEMLNPCVVSFGNDMICRVRQEKGVLEHGCLRHVGAAVST